MGIFTTLLTQLGLVKRRCNLLLVGLDNSGKSTLLNHLKPDRVPDNEIVPTVGFNLEQFSKNRIRFTVFDMSGQGRYRDLWQHYYPETDGIIFVIDSADTVRICVARDELETMLQHDALRHRPVPILFLANKNDLPQGMPQSEISHALDLQVIKDRAWYICSTNALTGVGVAEGLDWLAEQLSDS